MVVDSLSDGTRIAQLLASEVTGHEDAFSVLSVVDSDPDVEPTDDGALAYAVAGRFPSVGAEVVCLRVIGARLVTAHRSITSSGAPTISPSSQT